MVSSRSVATPSSAQRETPATEDTAAVDGLRGFAVFHIIVGHLFMCLVRLVVSSTHQTTEAHHRHIGGKNVVSSFSRWGLFQKCW